MPLIFPADAETVWVRHRMWTSWPYKAVFDLAAGTFADPNSGYVLDWTAIARWRHL